MRSVNLLKNRSKCSHEPAVVCFEISWPELAKATISIVGRWSRYFSTCSDLSSASGRPPPIASTGQWTLARSSQNDTCEDSLNGANHVRFPIPESGSDRTRSADEDPRTRTLNYCRPSLLKRVNDFIQVRCSILAWLP